MRRTAGSFEGRPCVAVFEWSDQRIHCPGLTCKLLDRALGLRIGETAALGGFALDDPRVLSMLRRRHGEAASPGETVITPQATFDSPLLEAVAER